MASQPLPTSRVRRHSPIGSLVLTFGCRFGCDYCPIPAYNQRQFRSKSGARIAEEMTRLHEEYGIGYFFGADDNFLNDRSRALEIAETLAATEIQGAALNHKVRWGTEATVHDTLAMKDHLRTLRKAGLRALWMGVEDMTGALVRKGQTPDQTRQAFAMLRERGIFPMPMLMHHDAQPLFTRGRPEGLLNQVKLLREAGAISLQVLMITPGAGLQELRGRLHLRAGSRTGRRQTRRAAHEWTATTWSLAGTHMRGGSSSTSWLRTCTSTTRCDS